MVTAHIPSYWLSCSCSLWVIKQGQHQINQSQFGSLGFYYGVYFVVVNYVAEI